MVKQKIIEHHGRVEDITLFDCDPNKEELELYRKKQAEPKPSNDLEASDEESEDSEPKALKKKEPEWMPTFKHFDNDSAYLYEIFEECNGWKTKKEAKENMKTLYYNFQPHDKNDPVLLTLMQHD
jgi:hypothetical protein